MRCRLLFTIVLTLTASVAGAQTPQDVSAFRKTLQAKLAAGDAQEATAVFKAALKSAANPQQKKAIREEYLRGMARAGKPIDAYRAFPGGRDSFRTLAEQLVASGHGKALANLIAEHETFFDDDPYLSVYRGQLAFESKQYAAADTAWTAAFKGVDDQFLVEQFHRRRVLARYHAGKVAEAIDEFPPKSTAFQIIADECLRNRKPDELEKLLELYRSENKVSEFAMFEYQLRIRPDAAGAVLEKIAASPAEVGLLRTSNLTSLYSLMAGHGRALDAYKAAPDKKFAFDTLAYFLLYDKQFSDFRPLIELHRKTAPNDPALRQAEGELYLGTLDLEKAIACLKSAEENPAKRPAFQRSSLILLGGYKYADACVVAGKGLQAYEESGFDSILFSHLASKYFAARDAAGLEALLKAQQNAVPAKKTLGRQTWENEARLQILKGNAEEALKLFVANRPATTSPFGSPFPPLPIKGKVKAPRPVPGRFGKATRDPELENSRVRNLESSFMRDMASAGEGMAVYLVAKFPENAFQTLASHYRRERDVKALAKLVAEHQVKHPKDAQLPTYRGYVELLTGNAAEAEQIFRVELAKPATVPGDALAKIVAAGTRRQLRDGLMRAAIRQGHAVEYYRSAGSDTATFVALAEFCVDEKAAGELDALLAIHRKTHPDDANLLRFEGDLLFLKGDYEAALPKFKTTLKRRNFERRIASDLANDLDERDKVLVCLVRLKRQTEAVRLAAEWQQNAPGRHPVVHVLAYAANQDVKQTERLLEIYTRQGHHIELFYRNDDLGPLLRGDAFQAVRARFPAPTK